MAYSTTTHVFARESNKRPPSFRSPYPSSVESGRVDARVDVRMAFAFSSIRTNGTVSIPQSCTREATWLGGYVKWNDHGVASISWDLRNGFG